MPAGKSSRSRRARRRSMHPGPARSSPRRCAFSGSPRATISLGPFATGTPRASRRVVPSRAHENHPNRSGPSRDSVHVRRPRASHPATRLLPRAGRDRRRAARLGRRLCIQLPQRGGRGRQRHDRSARGGAGCVGYLGPRPEAAEAPAYLRPLRHPGLRAFRPRRLLWLEEPAFPPENYEALRAAGDAGGMPIAAGENLCFETQFQALFDAGAVNFAQPSVIKVGGITEFVKVVKLAEKYRVRIAPHSPYFGPGALATAHLLAAQVPEGRFERFYLSAEATLYPGLFEKAQMTLPEGPGLGRDPDPEVLRRYPV